MNPEYTKALVKRGEINQALGDYAEAVRDFSKAAQIDPSKFLYQKTIILIHFTCVDGFGA